MSYKAIDVSVFNGSIDWKRVKDDGVTAAIIRVGGRYGVSGKMYTDIMGYDNIKKAINAGLKVGVYYFTQAVNTSEAVEEAEFTINAIKDFKKNITMPVYIDSEYLSEGRHNNIGVTKRTEVCKAFCDRVAKEGYKTGVYASTSWLNNQLDMSYLSKYEVWVAQYNDVCQYRGKYGMWQYSSTGRVNGVSGDVDVNKGYIEYWKGSSPSPDPTPTPSSDKLVEDGLFGYLSAKAAQKWAKCSVIDGIISGQVRSMQKYLPNVYSIEWGLGGSPFVRKLQAIIGAEVDGYLGPKTVMALQRYLNKKGYNLVVDGYWGSATSKAFQNLLNKELKL